jgi:phage shock protein A
VATYRDGPLRRATKHDEHIEDLAEAVTALAGAVEELASRMCDFDATNEAQIARERAAQVVPEATG